MPLHPAAQTSQKRPLGAYLREWHSYISAFIAPMMLFFASSGALQIFNLHESHAGYVAPAIVRAAARIHKEQEAGSQRARGFESRPPQSVPSPGGGPDGGNGPDRTPVWSTSTLALKWLFFIEACALVVTTLLGVWIGFVHAKRRRTIVGLLVAGIILPAALIVWQVRSVSP